MSTTYIEAAVSSVVHKDPTTVMNRHVERMTEDRISKSVMKEKTADNIEMEMLGLRRMRTLGQ